MSVDFQIAVWFLGQTVTLALITIGAIKFLLGREEARIMEVLNNKMATRIEEHDSSIYAHRPAADYYHREINENMTKLLNAVGALNTNVAVILTKYDNLAGKISNMEAEEDE